MVASSSIRGWLLAGSDQDCTPKRGQPGWDDLGFTLGCICRFGRLRFQEMTLSPPDDGAPRSRMRWVMGFPDHLFHEVMGRPPVSRGCRVRRGGRIMIA